MSGNPTGRPSRLTKVGETSLKEMFKPVEAKVNGEIVRVPQHVLFHPTADKGGHHRRRPGEEAGAEVPGPAAVADPVWRTGLWDRLGSDPSPGPS